MESFGPCTQHALVHQKARLGFLGEHGTLLHTGIASHGVTQSTLHTLVHQTSLLVRVGFRVVVTPDDDPP